MGHVYLLESKLRRPWRKDKNEQKLHNLLHKSIKQTCNYCFSQQEVSVPGEGHSTFWLWRFKKAQVHAWPTFYKINRVIRLHHQIHPRCDAQSKACGSPSAPTYRFTMHFNDTLHISIYFQSQETLNAVSTHCKSPCACSQALPSIKVYIAKNLKSLLVVTQGLSKGAIKHQTKVGSDKRHAKCYLNIHKGSLGVPGPCSPQND